jgi:hypothetical protein
MRRETDYFGEAELDLVYMARRLSDALALETILTESGVDYLVETGTYSSGFILRRELTGAFFYVAPKDLQAARHLLASRNLKPYEPE